MFDPGLKRKIDDASVVAFDVFDTLIVRPFFRPDHVFDYIESVKHCDGFARARVSAERDARHSICPEITLDEIYSLIDPKYSSLKEFEMEAELSLCRPDPLTKDVWDYCLSEKKRVVILSDMYLSSGFIGRMLEKCGYSGWSELLVSCEQRIAKCTGELYSKIEGDRCLMIGDNRNSDYRKPAENGWDSYLWTALKDRYRAAHAAESKFLEKGFGYSLIAGADMYLWAFGEEHDYWHSVGLRFGGPLVTMYARFVMENTEGSDCLFFLSRDGYMAKKAYEVLGGDVPAKYVYSSRFLKELYGPEVPKERSEQFGIFAEQCRLAGIEPYSRFESGRAGYIDYLNGCAEDYRKITVVDSTTLEFTSQKHLVSVLGDRIAGGCYYSIIRKKNGNRCYADRSGELISWTHVNLSEFLMSSDEPPIWDVDAEGKPCYMSNGSEHEDYRRSVMRDIHEGEEEYISMFSGLYSLGLPLVDSKVIDQWLDVLVKSETVDDVHHVRGMKWPVDMTNTKFVDMVWRPRDLGHSMVTLAGSILKRLGFRR